MLRLRPSAQLSEAVHTEKQLVPGCWAELMTKTADTCRVLIESRWLFARTFVSMSMTSTTAPIPFYRLQRNQRPNGRQRDVLNEKKGVSRVRQFNN
jgi:hypothetical protein